jgi:hypothetical protein
MKNFAARNPAVFAALALEAEQKGVTPGRLARHKLHALFEERIRHLKPLAILQSAINPPATKVLAYGSYHELTSRINLAWEQQEMARRRVRFEIEQGRRIV